jgi:hypothetical protein
LYQKKVDNNFDIFIYLNLFYFFFEFKCLGFNFFDIQNKKQLKTIECQILELKYLFFFNSYKLSIETWLIKIQKIKILGKKVYFACAVY